jgi:hypothetical protein
MSASASLCDELRLTAAIAQGYAELAQTAVKEEQSFADFLEAVAGIVPALGEKRAA